MTEVRDLFLRSHSIGTSYGVAFSPDGNVVCAIGRNVVLWDAHRRRRLASAHPFSHPAHVSFVPDDDSVLVKNTAGDVVRLDAVTLGVRSALGGREHGEGPGPISMPQGLFVEGSWGGLLMVRSVEDGRMVFTELHPDSMVVDVAASADRSLIAYVVKARGDSRGQMLRVRSWPFSDDQPGTTLQFDGRGSAVVALGPDGIIATVDPEFVTLRSLNGALLARRSVPISGTGRSLAWRPGTNELVMTGAREVTCLDSNLDVVWSRALPYAASVDFSHDGHLMALGDWQAGRVGAVGSADR